MSASLVGSEMCIRDSPDAPGPHHRGPGASGQRRQWQCARVWLSCRQRPVSYTHLTLPTICSV
eukprot:9701876-Alexandrium_andersonii.AAC.1